MLRGAVIMYFFFNVAAGEEESLRARLLTNSTRACAYPIALY
jgi:hypothetical protein